MADLFALIEKKKLEGSLAPFDPAGHYIHPLSRVKLTIRFTRSISDSFPGSEDEGSSSEEEDDQEDEYRITRTRPKRLTRAKPGALPFSPRKSRARKLLTIRDSDSSHTDVDSDDPPLPVRRSLRGRKTTEIELDSDSDYDAQKDTPSRRIKLLGPKKKSSRPRSVIPSLGRVRDISTVDEDPFDNDDEKEVLRLHRRVCEKCHEGPAHGLLASLKKKSKGKGKKRKRDTDDEFEWSDDAEKLTSLGGWVQWFAFLYTPFFTYWSKQTFSASSVPFPLTGIVWQVLRKTRS